MNIEFSNAKELRPDETGFFKYQLGIHILLTVVVCACLIIGIEFANDSVIKDLDIQISVWFILGPAILLMIYNVLNIQAQYTKTKYTIYKDRIIFHGGSLFSDFENELNYKNVTRLSLILPYGENFFCKTGHILVESAGAATTEINFKSMSNPQALYNEILSALKENGFQLKKENLIFPRALIFLAIPNPFRRGCRCVCLRHLMAKPEVRF